MKTLLNIVVFANILFFGGASLHAEDVTEFVDNLNSQWTAKNYNACLLGINTRLSTNTNDLPALFAKACYYVFVNADFEGSTNIFAIIDPLLSADVSTNHATIMKLYERIRDDIKVCILIPMTNLPPAEQRQYLRDSLYPTSYPEQRLLRLLGSAQLTGDTDADGMPNEWETQHGFNPNDPSDAAGDADGDGFANVQEYHMGTNPRIHFTKDALILYYTFDNDSGTTVVDQSGNGNNGAIKNDPEYVVGLMGKSLKVTGQAEVNGTGGDHVLMPYIDFPAKEAFTISLWVNAQAVEFEGGEAYISMGDNDIDGKEIAIIQDDPLHGGVGNLRYRMGVAGNTINIPWGESDRNRYVFYCMTYHDGVMKVYKDGDFKGDKTGVEPVLSSTNAALARHWWYWQGHRTSTRLSGILDEVSIFNRELSSNEVQKLYQWPTLDNDADSLPDWWELKYFGDCDETADGDQDSDEAANLEEYQLGKDPTDPNSF